MAENSFPIADGGNVDESTYERLMAQTHAVGRVILAAGQNEPITSGYTNPLVYADSTGRQLKIAANQAYQIRGYRWESGTDILVKALDPNISGKTRIDRAVLRLDRSTYTIRAAIIPGTPADAPVPPAVTRQFGSTGVYEVAIGRATVTSNSTSGLPSIAAADVVDESVFLAMPGQAGSRILMPAALPAGSIYSQVDAQRMWAGAGGDPFILGEHGPATKIAPVAGWTGDAIYAQRINGFVWLTVQTTLNLPDRAANLDTLVCTLPPQFRPAMSFYIPATMTPAQAGFCFVNSTTGVVTVSSFSQTFPNGGKLNAGPVCWPANGVIA